MDANRVAPSRQAPVIILLNEPGSLFGGECRGSVLWCILAVLIATTRNGCQGQVRKKNKMINLYPKKKKNKKNYNYIKQKRENKRKIPRLRRWDPIQSGALKIDMGSVSIAFIFISSFNATSLFALSTCYSALLLCDHFSLTSLFDSSFVYILIPHPSSVVRSFPRFLVRSFASSLVCFVRRSLSSLACCYI